MPTIAIIEDSTAIRLFVAVNLKARGYRVVEADNAHDGLKLFSAEPLDLVLLDNGIPGMSGVDLARHTAADPLHAHVPIILLTGASHETLGDTSDIPTIRGILTKPISLDDLIQAVTNALHPQ